jgi:hypothetical protein
MTARGNDYDNASTSTTADLGVVSRIDTEEGELAVDFDGREIKLEEATLHGRLAIAAETALLSPSRTLVGSVRSERRPNRSTAPERCARSARVAV